jgi:toxin FitB
LSSFEIIGHFAEIVAKPEKSGRNPTTANAQIAAIAFSRQITLATRNVRDFEGLRIELINPWDAQIG